MSTSVPTIQSVHKSAWTRPVKSCGARPKEKYRPSQRRMASQLNRPECEISAMARQCLDRRIPDKETLDREIRAWVDRRNRDRVTIEWRFTTADARIKLRRLYPVLKLSKSERTS